MKGFMKKKTSILFLALGVVLSGCGINEPPVKVRPPVPITAFEVVEETIPAPFEFVGVAKSSHPVEIRARVEGYLWSINYLEGSAVKRGDLLFVIDPLPFEASVEEAKAALEGYSAVLWRAQKSLDRITPLFAKNAASQKDLDDATADVLTAKASVLAAQANLVQAELNLSYTRVTSPIDGLSGRAAFREGTLITPSVNGLLTLVSVIDPIWVLFSVSDNQMLQGQGEKAKNELILPPQQEFTVTLELSDGTMFPYSGKVNFTSPTLDPATGALVVRATFPNPQGLILPGQFVRAHVSGAVRPNAIFVPQKAVFQGQTGMYVFIVKSDNTVSLQAVEPGEWYGDYWIIKQGLSPGDVVVLEGTNKLVEGSSVVITSKQLPSKAAL